MEVGRRSGQASRARSLTCTRIPAMFLLVVVLFLGECSAPTVHGVMEDNGGFGGSHVHSSFLNRSRGLRRKPTIVNGGPIPRSAAPYQVLLLVKTDVPGVDQYCGGVLIDPQYVVSAAHCTVFLNDEDIAIFYPKPRHLSVRVGSVEKDSGGEVIAVQRFWRHHRYKTSNPDFKYDVLLIQLKRPVKISWDVIPIKLAWDDRKLVKNADIAVSGWGDMWYEGPSSKNLTGTIVNHLPYSCSQAYKNFDPRLMICAGCSQGGVGACQGDSGGPAVVSSSSGGCPTLVGVTSFAKGCAVPGYPNGYTRISAVVDWLESKAQKSFRTPYALAPRMNCDVCSTGGAGSCGWKFHQLRCLAEGWVASAFIFRLLPCPTGTEARMRAYFDPSMGSSPPTGKVCFLQGRSGNSFSAVRVGSHIITVRLSRPIKYQCYHPIKKGYWSVRWTSQGLSPCSSTYRYAAVYMSGDKSVIEVSYPAAYT